jgi:hypothetical protein
MRWVGAEDFPPLLILADLAAYRADVNGRETPLA